VPPPLCLSTENIQQAEPRSSGVKSWFIWRVAEGQDLPLCLPGHVSSPLPDTQPHFRNHQYLSRLRIGGCYSP